MKSILNILLALALASVAVLAYYVILTYTGD